MDYIFSLFWKTKTPVEAPLPLDEAYNVITECEEKPVQEQAEDGERKEEIGTYEVLSKVGKITKIENGTYQIDNLYDFTSDLPDISIGTKISYQLIKSTAGEIKICDVNVLENDWNVIEDATIKKTWHERILVCNVVKRDNRVLTLSPGNIQVNLNSISSEFIPIEGDWVELDVKCEIDENVVDLSGKIIEINKLQPLRSQVKMGFVTQWNGTNFTGVVDKIIYFDKDSLYCGFLPVRGDRVIAEIIESNQGTCNWRALKIVPDHYLQAKDNKNVEHEKEGDCRTTHDSVRITDNIVLSFMKLGETKLFTVELESREEIQLVCIEIPKLNSQCRLISTIDHITLKPGRPFIVRIECKARTVGDSRELLIFHFDKNLKLGRWVTINVASYKPKNVREYKGKEKHIVSRLNKEVVRGEKIQSSVRFLPLHMPDFAVPERLLKLLTEHRHHVNYLKVELEKMKPCLVTGLTYMNFEDKFHTLLHLEEIHTILEMQNYDQERACFQKSGEYLVLQIDNLAERRPSVIQGDRVMARSIQDSSSPDFEGYIHKIAKNHVYIKFSPMFHNTYDDEDYSIFIIASRVTYRRKHFAVNLAVKNLGKDWLFPTKVIEKESQLDFVVDEYDDSLNSSKEEPDSPTSKQSHNILGKEKLLEKIKKFQESPNQLPKRKLEWHTPYLNCYQKEAVRNALLGVCRPLPYIIFGPPGTGKTVTIVETVLQILRLMPHSRILLCAPSNSAVDLLAVRLIESGVLKPGDLIRLVAITAVNSIPAKLAPYCATANIEREGTETSLPLVGPNGLVSGLSSTVLGRHRITVTTCSSAGLLYSMGFSKGHFSHIIVDEAGQTSEPSVLIPLAFLDTLSGQAILAGDPMQLGPVILSALASDYGLEESFLERMICRFPYIRDTQGFPKTFGYDPRLITKLIYNYRSLPNILKLPSLLFYHDDLIPTISEENSKEGTLLNELAEILPRDKKNNIASIVFHGVVGENFQSEDSPSWYNPNEAAQVFFYVNELFRLGTKASDIGIITPYKAQIKQLMELFKEANFDIPKVGTVEEFQGQEFNIVIVSTVRSNKKFVAADLKYTMGFISSPRRLNVAITRAKALLIIVGNAKLLSGDRSWRSVINYCHDKGTFIGSSYK